MLQGASISSPLVVSSLRLWFAFGDFSRLAQVLVYQLLYNPYHAVLWYSPDMRTRVSSFLGRPSLIKLVLLCQNYKM